MKKIISMLSATVFLSGLCSAPVCAEEYAADNNIIIEESQNIFPEPDALPYAVKGTATSDLSISGTTALCKSNASGEKDVTKINMYQYLDKYESGSWNKIATWYDVTSGSMLTMENTRKSLSKGKYRLRTVATFYIGNTPYKYTVISATKIV